MKDLLKNLREHLSAMIEEIDNYTHANSDDIIVKKEDFKYVNCSQEISGLKVFRFKQDIVFEFHLNKKYHDKIYNELIEGSLNQLILNKMKKSHIRGADRINYKLESDVNTKLRKAYRPIAEDNEEN